MTSNGKTEKFPREALEDILLRIVDHVKLYECQVSLAFDGDMYRVNISGEGERKAGD